MNKKRFLCDSEDSVIDFNEWCKMSDFFENLFWERRQQTAFEKNKNFSRGHSSTMLDIHTTKNYNNYFCQFIVG